MRSKGKTKTNLAGAYLYGAQFYYANMADAVLIGAQLNDADLGGTDLTGADLKFANLTHAYLYGAKYDSTTIWPTAEYWDNTTCPDGSNSDDPENATCGF